MTTQLASQLQKLQVRVTDEKRLNNSFLFDKADAHRYSREQILQLAVHGLQSLIALDNRFHAFIEPLFDAQKVRRERGTLSAEENRVLDVQLEHLLTLLSPHFFLHAAQQVFEYLVRVYEVHVYNVSAVLRAFLPYHDHNLFVRALMLLDLRDSGFGFLATNQERGAPLLREHLVLACAESRKALRLLCLTMAMPVRLHVQHQAAYALFTAVACALAARPEAEAIWRVLLPYVLEFMSVTESKNTKTMETRPLYGEEGNSQAGDEAEHTEGFTADEQPTHTSLNSLTDTTLTAAPLLVQREVVCTALIVVAAWSASVKFSAAMLQAIMTPTCALLRRVGNSTNTLAYASSLSTMDGVGVVVPLQDLLSFVDVLFDSHGDVVTQVELSATLNTLLAMPWSQWVVQLSPLLQRIEKANAAQGNTTNSNVVLFESLVSTLMNVCLDRLRVAHSICSVASDVLMFLRCAATQLPLPARLVRRFMRVLLTSDLSTQSTTTTEEVQTKGKDDEEDDDFYCDVMQALERRYQNIFDSTLSAALQDSQTARAATAFLAAHLHGTRYTAVDLQSITSNNNETAQLRVSSLPLFACLLHSLPAVRQCGAKAMEEMSLEQLVPQCTAGNAKTDKNNAATSDGALLELLIQVCAYESDATVAVSFLRVLGPVMQQLVSRIQQQQEEVNHTNEEGQKENTQGEMYETLLAQMLRSLEAMLALHCSGKGTNTGEPSCEVQSAYVELICVPLMRSAAQKNSSEAQSPKKAASGKRGKAHKATTSEGSNNNSLLQTRLRGMVLYYTVYSYLLLQQEEESKADDTSVTTNKVLSATLLQLLQEEYPAVTNASRTKTHNTDGSNNSSENDEIEDDESTSRTPFMQALRALMQAPSLLLALHEEAQARLPQLLRRVQEELREQSQSVTTNNDSSSSLPSVKCNVSAALLMECGLAVAACAFAELRGSAKGSTIATLLRFFCGDNTTLSGNTNEATSQQQQQRPMSEWMSEASHAGYLGLLQELHRQSARLHNSAASHHAAVGRGAENSLLTRPFLPSNNLTKQLADILHTVFSMEVTPVTQDNTPITDAETSDTIRVSLIDIYVGLMQLLAHLSAPLPPLTVSTTDSPAMALAFMSLLDPSSPYMTETNTDGQSVKSKKKNKAAGGVGKGSSVRPTIALSTQRYGIDWYGLVHAAVYNITHTTTNNSNTVVVPSCNALALVMLLPLWAPPAQRLSLLRTLQDMIVQSVSKKAKQGPAQTIVAAALQQHNNSKSNNESNSYLSYVSVTSLSALVEAMANDTQESRSALPSSASRLLCAMLAGDETSNTVQTLNSIICEEYGALPFALATQVIEYFYALPEGTTKKAAVRGKAELDLTFLLPRVRRALSCVHTPMQADAVTSFVLAIARRMPLTLQNVNEITGTPAHKTKSKTHTEAQSAIADTHPALALCTLLLEQPHVRLTDGTLRPVYRPALTWLAHALQQCSEATGRTSFSAKRSHGPSIFRSKRTGQKDSTQQEQVVETNDTAVLDATFAQEVTSYLRPVLLRAMQRIGGDVTRLCVLTQGGYESVFLPFLNDLAAQATTSHTNNDTTCAISEEQWRVLEEMLEMLTPQAHTNTPDTQTNTVVAPTVEAWQPPTSCLAQQPLRCAHVMQLVQLCAQCLSQTSHDIPTTTTTININKASEGVVQGWQCRVDNVHALRVLTLILRAAPVIVFDEHHQNDNDSDSDEEEEGKSEKATRMTFYEFMTTLLSTFPLEQLWPLLASDEAVKEEAPHKNTFLLNRTRSGETQSNVFGVNGGLYARYAFGFLAELVHTAIAQTQALCASFADGDVKLRQALVKQCLLLMARLLTQSTTTTQDDKESVTREMGASHITDTVAELLRVLSPLLTRRRKRRNAHNASQSVIEGEEEQQGFLLHIPLVALLVRMEEAEYSAALRYTSAVDLCRTILLSFDIQSQMRCLAQLMQLLVDPYAALGHHTNDAEDEEDEDVVHVLRRLLKPNQVINRQETILNLINTTVKASAFLSKFVALQYHSKSALVEDKEEEEEVKELRHVAPAVPPSRSDTSDGCMQLLVSALELYTHYTDLNTNTENDLPTQENTISSKKKNSKGDEVTVLYGEQKAYVMLLELLSGNTLACVLAGINESTFVQCLLQLLRDERPSLRRKGLEVLLDRLHHSLPTVEHTISDADLARHRAALRDPKKKLTLMDLVKLKARPLTTKRSLHLFPLLTTHVQESLQHLLGTRNTSTDALVDAELERHGVTAQLAVACIEELVRIVACGGSMQAEKTLLNVSRSKRLTEALLAKLFGNKARVQAVHACLTSWCEQDLPNMLKALTTTSRNTSESNGTEVYKTAIMVVMSAMFTALGTAVQAMGEAFAAPHSQALLRILVASATQAVITLPFTVATSTAGSLLRHTTLSCLIRAFPACWQFSQPYLPHLLFTVTHMITVQDTNTSYLATELLTVLEALLEPQLLLEAGIECLRGVRQDPTDQTNEKKKKGEVELRRGQSSVLRIRLETHSLELFYGCVLRRVQNLKPEELTALTVLIGGSTARDNFWLASLQMVAHATSTPTSTTVMPILEAFTAFFVKFRPQQCTALLQLITEWAFSESDTPNNNNDKIMESDEASGHRHRQRMKKSIDAGYEHEDAEDSDAVNEEGVVSRTRLQSWLLFYVVYNHLLEKLGPIMDFAYPVALPHLLRLLTEYCADSSPTRRVPFVALVTLCLEQALDAMRRMAVAQTPGPDYDYSIPLDIYFATAEVFNGAMPALVHQLTNTVYLQDTTQDYATRAEQSVIPAIRAFFACLNSNKLQGKTQSELLRGLRHPSRHVRRLTLRCLDGIYADGGDELAARLMAEMLPSVVELTEDRDDAVVEEARTLCVNLSRMTGQDVLHAMSN